MNRAEFQKLANVRIREARTLFDAREFSGAYYLAGYAIECALKACFAKSVRRYDFPDKVDSRKVFTHKLTELAELAKLSNDVETERKTNFKFEAGWNLVRRWSEESRYSLWSESDAKAILNAVTRRKDGVLPWIKRRW